MASGSKRSLFSKPAWAAAGPAASSKPANDESIFGRNVVYEDILAAERRKREKKLARTKEKEKERADLIKDEGRGAKRRRVSVEPKEPPVEYPSDSDGKSVSSVASAKDGAMPAEDRPVTRSTPTKSKKLQVGLDSYPKPYHSPRRNPPTKTTSYGLYSDDQAEDDDLIVLTPPKRKKSALSDPKPQTQSDEMESDEEDEFLQELKRKAREKARLQKLGIVDSERPRTPITAAAALSASATPTAIARSSSAEQSRPVSSNSAPEDRRETPNLEKERESEDDPEVKILINSSIPDTKPLIAKRRASQSLKQVKEFWCKRNNLDPKTSAKVFFTWRGTRLFDSTTMRGIIQKLKNDHASARQRATFDDEDEDEVGDKARVVEDPSEGRIIVEAMTPEIFEERQRERERKAQQPNYNSGDDGPDDEDDDTYAEQEAARARAQKEAEEKLKGSIVVRLVSQTVEPMNLRVRPHTSVGKMMQGFAAARRLEEGKTAWLVFDGERLDPERTVKDLGLEDEDEIEVHIR